MDRKELEKYLRPSGGLMVIAVIMGGMAIMLLCGGLILPSLVALVPCVICGGVSLSSASAFKKQLEAMEAIGEMPGILREFVTGKQFFGDKLRIGSNYILGKRSGVILTHDQVRKVYQHIHRTNFVEDRRELRVETAAGKTVIVCSLPLRGKGDQELIQAISIVKAMNPGVHIGYK